MRRKRGKEHQAFLSTDNNQQQPRARHTLQRNLFLMFIASISFFALACSDEQGKIPMARKQ